MPKVRYNTFGGKKSSFDPSDIQAEKPLPFQLLTDLTNDSEFGALVKDKGWLETHDNSAIREVDLEIATDFYTREDDGARWHVSDGVYIWSVVLQHKVGSHVQAHLHRTDIDGQNHITATTADLGITPVGIGYWGEVACTWNEHEDKIYIVFLGNNGTVGPVRSFALVEVSDIRTGAFTFNTLDTQSDGDPAWMAGEVFAQGSLDVLSFEDSTSTSIVVFSVGIVGSKVKVAEWDIDTAAYTMPPQDYASATRNARILGADGGYGEPTAFVYVYYTENDALKRGSYLDPTGMLHQTLVAANVDPAYSLRVAEDGTDLYVFYKSIADVYLRYFKNITGVVTTWNVTLWNAWTASVYNGQPLILYSLTTQSTVKKHFYFGSAWYNVLASTAMTYGAIHLGCVQDNQGGQEKFSFTYIDTSGITGTDVYYEVVNDSLEFFNLINAEFALPGGVMDPQWIVDAQNSGDGRRIWRYSENWMTWKLFESAVTYTIPAEGVDDNGYTNKARFVAHNNVVRAMLGIDYPQLRMFYLDEIFFPNILTEGISTAASHEIAIDQFVLDKSNVHTPSAFPDINSTPAWPGGRAVITSSSELEWGLDTTEGLCDNPGNESAVIIGAFEDIPFASVFYLMVAEDVLGNFSFPYGWGDPPRGMISPATIGDHFALFIRLQMLTANIPDIPLIKNYHLFRAIVEEHNPRLPESPGYRDYDRYPAMDFRFVQTIPATSDWNTISRMYSATYAVGPPKNFHTLVLSGMGIPTAPDQYWALDLFLEVYTIADVLVGVVRISDLVVGPPFEYRIDGSETTVPAAGNCYVRFVPQWHYVLVSGDFRTTIVDRQKNLDDSPTLQSFLGYTPPALPTNALISGPTVAPYSTLYSTLSTVVNEQFFFIGNKIDPNDVFLENGSSVAYGIAWANRNGLGVVNPDHIPLGNYRYTKDRPTSMAELADRLLVFYASHLEIGIVSGEDREWSFIDSIKGAGAVGYDAAVEGEGYIWHLDSDYNVRMTDANGVSQIISLDIRPDLEALDDDVYKNGIVVFNEKKRRLLVHFYLTGDTSGDSGKGWWYNLDTKAWRKTSFPTNDLYALRETAIDLNGNLVGCTKDKIVSLDSKTATDFAGQVMAPSFKTPRFDLNSPELSKGFVALTFDYESDTKIQIQVMVEDLVLGEYELADTSGDRVVVDVPIEYTKSDGKYLTAYVYLDLADKATNTIFKINSIGIEAEMLGYPDGR